MSVKRYNPFKSPGFYITVGLGAAWYTAVLLVIVQWDPPKPVPYIAAQPHRPSPADIQRGLDYLRHEEQLDHERRMRLSMDSIDWSLQRIANDQSRGD